MFQTSCSDLRKREEFAVSLRSRKRALILSQKRKKMQDLGQLNQICQDIASSKEPAKLSKLADELG
jgi:hypothetical protein